MSKQQEQPLVQEVREASAQLATLADNLQETFEHLEEQVDDMARIALEAFEAKYLPKISKLERMKRAIGAILR